MLLEKLRLDDDEVILKTFRKHWWNIVANLAILGTIAILPLLALMFINFLPGEVGQNLHRNLLVWLEANYAIITYGYSFWLLFVLIGIGNFWTDHYLDVWVVTNRRVVLVDQRGFFRRFVSSFRLERLQDMNIEVNGFIATILDFGTIEAQTAGGSNEEFIGKMLPHPREIKALIVKSADDLTATQSKRIANLQEQGL